MLWIWIVLFVILYHLCWGNYFNLSLWMKHTVSIIEYILVILPTETLSLPLTVLFFFSPFSVYHVVPLMPEWVKIFRTTRWWMIPPRWKCQETSLQNVHKNAFSPNYPFNSSSWKQMSSFYGFECSVKKRCFNRYPWTLLMKVLTETLPSNSSTNLLVQSTQKVSNWLMH